MSDVLNKVRKLLRLAESPNANEAALAAAKAQQLIDEHNLSAALLAIDAGDEQEADEPIEDFASKDAPLDEGGRRERWRTVLASTVAYANGCRIYLNGSGIAIVGRPSDADTVRYLYAYLLRETTRLCDRDGKGCGLVWRNNYRLGVVDAIRLKLKAQREKFKQDARQATTGTALVRVDKALAKVESRGADVSLWMKNNLKLVSGRGGGGQADIGARMRGQKAGQSISLNRAKRSLTA